MLFKRRSRAHFARERVPWRRVVAVVGLDWKRSGPGVEPSSPDGRRTWVALGETAHTIVVLDTSMPTRPRVVARMRLPSPGHDLMFAPDGRTVW
jgi:hypothetical protein